MVADSEDVATFAYINVLMPPNPILQMLGSRGILGKLNSPILYCCILPPVKLS